MRKTVRASEEGLKKIDIAMNKKGWCKTQAAWVDLAETSESTLKRFWVRDSITKKLFEKICNVVGIEDWETVADLTEIEDIDITPHQWIGREEDLESIKSLIKKGKKVIAVYGQGGIGKTTLADNLFDIYGFTKRTILELRVATKKEDVEPIENILDAWLQGTFKQKPGRNLMAKLDQIKNNLQNKRFGILIDNLETTLDKNGRFYSNHRGFIELFRVLDSQSVQSITIVTSREKICEPEISLESHQLEGLSYSSWEKFFRIHEIHINEAVLKKIHEAYGGNAKAMGIISGDVCRDFDKDLSSYWEENSKEFLYGELKNLVSDQFERLQIEDCQAYSLLCRLGIYRYQNISTIDRDSILSLLWDAPKDSQVKAIISLRNRYLLEFRKGEYWLHPVFQEESISRLNSEIEQEKSHQKAAEFYFNSIDDSEDFEQIKLAFEAFYHFYKAKSFDYCSKTLLYKILGAEETNLENLRYSINIWKYTSRILEIGESILNKLQDKEKMLSLIPVGICYSDLGKNDKALKISQEIIDIANRLNRADEEIIFAKTAAYSIAGRANRLIGKFQDSLNSCELATRTARRSKSHQTKALALYELGRAYVDIKKPGRALNCFVVAAFQSVGMKVAGEIYAFVGLLNVPIQEIVSKTEELLRKYEPDETDSNNIKKFRIIYSIAQCFNLMPIDQLAKFFSQKALAIAETVDRSSTTWAYLELAIYYDRIKDTKNSEAFYRKAEENLVDEDETFVIVTVLEKIASWHYRQARFTQAIDTYRDLETSLSKTDFRYLKAYAYYGLSMTYYKQERLLLARQNCDKALVIANELSLPLLSECQALIDKLQ